MIDVDALTFTIIHLYLDYFYFASVGIPEMELQM